MEPEQFEAVQRLRRELLPMRGLWHGVEEDLVALGVASLGDLRSRPADALLSEYCQKTARPTDPILALVFDALVKFASTGDPVPWWRAWRAHGGLAPDGGTAGGRLDAKSWTGRIRA